MPDLKSQLKARLRNAKNILLLGVGSDLRGDDAAGMLVAERLKNFKGKKNRFKVLFGSTAPENLTGEIKRLEPEHIIIVDSADIAKKAGSVVLLKPQELRGVTFSTHQLPLSIMVNYLMQSIDCEVTVIGIQPKNLKFGFSLSREVTKAVDSVAGAIREAISGR